MKMTDSTRKYDRYDIGHIPTESYVVKIKYSNAFIHFDEEKQEALFKENINGCLLFVKENAIKYINALISKNILEGIELEYIEFHKAYEEQMQRLSLGN